MLIPFAFSTILHGTIRTKSSRLDRIVADLKSLENKRQNLLEDILARAKDLERDDQQAKALLSERKQTEEEFARKRNSLYLYPGDQVIWLDDDEYRIGNISNIRGSPWTGLIEIDGDVLVPEGQVRKYQDAVWQRLQEWSLAITENHKEREELQTLQYQLFQEARDEDDRRSKGSTVIWQSPDEPPNYSKKKVAEVTPAGPRIQDSIGSFIVSFDDVVAYKAGLWRRFNLTRTAETSRNIRKLRAQQAKLFKPRTILPT